MLRRAGELLLGLLYPPHCALCGCRLDPEAPGEDAVFCWECLAGIAAPPGQRCPVCSHPLAGPIPCSNCNGRRWYLSAIIPACRYEGAPREMIQRFKYGRDMALARPLAVLLRRVWEDPRLRGKTFDALVPVPLHPLRERERGFNQAALLSSLLAKDTGVPDKHLLRRSRATLQQAGFDRARRMENLNGAFSLRSRMVPGSRILLVDDVSTTGVTLDACAAVLKKAEAAEVTAVVVARG